ncbi:cobalt-precorrin 5A hydrolase [Nitratidesulfovibrio sp. 1201_IL3209]|uniref:cobalt-precorrin 5A hydrolase n=1 Tax=Nitratidesulfovibrio sp. 1201_IL3209 TaxID=3084053 RepID=UPI002FDA4FFC
MTAMPHTPPHASARPLAVYALTPGGAALARRIAQALGGVVYLPDRLCAAGAQPFASLAELVARTFRLHPGHVFVAATGIVVRCIAPHITTKTDDPCVVVCDQRGAHAISLLSGHLGGGNDLARRVAAVTGGVPVITTATDTEGLPSFDLLAARAGLAMADITMVRYVNGALLAGETVWVCDPEDRLGLRATGPVPGIAAPPRPSPPQLSSPHSSARFRFVDAPGDLPSEAPSVLVTPHDHLAAPRRLVLHARVLHVGVGCKRGIDGAVIEARIREALSDAHLAPASIAALASADLKADEPGLRRAAAALNADLHFFDAAGLAAVPVPHPSPKAAEVLGVARVGVAEAAALLSARHARADAALLVPKSAGQGVTVAVAAPVDTSGPPPSPHSTASETTP